MGVEQQRRKILVSFEARGKEHSHCWVSAFDWNLCCLLKNEDEKEQKSTKVADKIICPHPSSPPQNLCFFLCPTWRTFCLLPERFSAITNKPKIASFSPLAINDTRDGIDKVKKRKLCCRFARWAQMKLNLLDEIELISLNVISSPRFWQELENENRNSEIGK